MNSVRSSWCRLITATAVLLGTTACTRHVRLVAPGTEASTRFVCDENKCSPPTDDDPSDAARAGTTFIPLPRECGGRHAEILILHVRRAKPEIRVTCAAPDEPVGRMGPAATAPEDLE